MTPNTPPETTAAELLELADWCAQFGDDERFKAAEKNLRKQAALKAQQPADLKTPGEIDAWFNGRFHAIEQAQQSSGAQAGLVSALRKICDTTRDGETLAIAGSALEKYDASPLPPNCQSKIAP